MPQAAAAPHHTAALLPHCNTNDGAVTGTTSYRSAAASVPPSAAAVPAAANGTSRHTCTRTRGAAPKPMAQL